MIARLPKFILATLILGFLTFGIYWLWQRQPKLESASQAQTQLINTPRKDQNEQLNLTPANFEVLNKLNFKIEGKVKADHYVLIYSDDFNIVLKADKNGSFSQDLELEEGLILVNLAVISQDFNQVSSKSVIWWVEEKVANDIENVIAGTVKTIFGNVLTTTTTDGEITVRTSKSTEFDIPQIKEGNRQSTASAISQLRIGDYVIALGKLSENDNLNASSLQIIRDDKPQIVKKLTVSKIVSDLDRKNNFKAKDNKSQETNTFNISGEAKIFLAENETSKKEIKKDQNVFIFYTPNNDTKTVDLIYIISK